MSVSTYKRWMTEGYLYEADVMDKKIKYEYDVRDPHNKKIKY